MAGTAISRPIMQNSESIRYFDDFTQTVMMPLQAGLLTPQRQTAMLECRIICLIYGIFNAWFQHAA
jgi:hypothetical protein